MKKMTKWLGGSAMTLALAVGGTLAAGLPAQAAVSDSAAQSVVTHRDNHGNDNNRSSDNKRTNDNNRNNDNKRNNDNNRNNDDNRNNDNNRTNNQRSRSFDECFVFFVNNGWNDRSSEQRTVFLACPLDFQHEFAADFH